MIIAFIILSVVSVVTGVVILNKMTEHLPEPPNDHNPDPPDFIEEPFVLDPPALPIFPDPIDWEGLSCKGIQAKLQEIREMLMVSKFPGEIYEFWVKQIEIGEEVFVQNCSVIYQEPVN